MELTIRKVSGPEWVRLRSSEDLGFIEPGQSRDVLFALNPPAATPTGQYDTRFEVRGGGLTAQYQVFVTLSASGRGDASFKIIDVLTGTADEQGRIRPGVPGASITLTHEESAAKVNAVTDAGGNARLENLPVGPYQYRVRKTRHKEGTSHI